MKTMQFKTNINCGGCLRGVTPFLDGQEKIEKWEIDLEHDDRVLTVTSDELTEKEIQAIVAEAGFRAEAKDA
ncbi:MAG: heavy-metal-associated domain-containing protein [Bacteroidota bacterium]